MNYINTDVNKYQIEYANTLSITLPTPNYVGYYKIGKEYSGLDIGLTEKPKWFHRKMMKICLGIEWFDN
jgi:hypothetical protein